LGRPPGAAGQEHRLVRGRAGAAHRGQGPARGLCRAGHGVRPQLRHQAADQPDADGDELGQALISSSRLRVSSPALTAWPEASKASLSAICRTVSVTMSPWPCTMRSALAERRLAAAIMPRAAMEIASMRAKLG